MHREPSGQDFLSPSLAEADVIRRVLTRTDFARWLDEFLPALRRDPGAWWLSPAVTRDRADGRLAHLDGLNLSRAWMLVGIGAGLPAEDARRPVLFAVADSHARAGMSSLASEHYEVAHWIGTFAVYFATQRGLVGERRHT